MLGVPSISTGHMNNSSDYLHDIELPAISLSPTILLLLILVTLLVLLAIAYAIYQQQRPIVRAKRQLHLLSTKANPQALATLLQQALQVKRLNDSSLPEDFLHRLDQARFSADPCSLQTFLYLKQYAHDFLEQLK